MKRGRLLSFATALLVFLALLSPVAAARGVGLDAAMLTGAAGTWGVEETGEAMQPDAEADLGAEAEPGAKTEVNAETEPDAGAEVNAEAEANSDPEAGAQPGADAEDAVETEPEGTAQAVTARPAAPAPAPAPAPGTSIEQQFPDANLAGRIAELMGREPGDVPAPEDYEQIVELHAAGLEIRTLDGIEVLKQLRRLDLSGNQLGALPEGLADLTQLQVLNLAGNRLEALPDAVCRLPDLTELDLRDNPLRGLPQSVAELPADCALFLAPADAWLALGEAWYYQGERGVLRDCWADINGARYRFDAAFRMRTGWLHEAGRLYYLRPGSGALATRWFEAGGAWYFAGPDGALQEGWLQDSGSWYYLDPARGGALESGWFKVEGRWYFAGASGALHRGWLLYRDKWYYLSPTSYALQSGWLKVDGRWYFAGASGALYRGWLEIAGRRYYLSPASYALQSGWFKVDGRWYFAGASGALHRGWLEYRDKWYYLNPTSYSLQSGWLKVDGRWYFAGASGALHRGWLEWAGKKYYLLPSGAMAVGWQEIGPSWYYFSASGAMYHSGFFTIDGKRYNFGADGAWIAPVDGRSGAGLDRPFTVNGVPVVNKQHRVSANYAPAVTSAYRPVAVAIDADLQALLRAAAAAGHALTVNSGYRSYYTQAEIYYSEVAIYGEAEANRTTAKPGESEHQTGLAVDFTDDYNSWASFSSSFGSLASGRWLANNAHRFGFILRYPRGREGVTGYTYEPWHFRHVGRAIAAEIGPNPTLTLEEYLGLAP